MTKYSNPRKRPQSYLRDLYDHWKKRRAGDKRGRGQAINSCWRPSSEASKADLRELHQEKMKLKKAHRRAG